MQISHFHRRENFITLYWFRNNSLTSTPSFSLHITLSLFKVLFSFFNCLLWSALYLQAIKRLSFIHVALSFLAQSWYLFSTRFQILFGCSEMLAYILEVEYFDGHIIFVVFSTASIGFWKWLFICQILSLFQNQACINIEWHSGTESIM